MRAILTQEVGEAPADPTNVALTGRVLGWVGFQGDMILTNDDIESSFDEEGWTELAYTPGSNATVVYVSSSTGSDTNSGLATNLAKATWAAALAVPSDGPTNAYILGRRGDTWSNTTISFSGRIRGISATRPCVLGAFGPTSDPRPVIAPGYLNGGIVTGNGDAGNDQGHSHVWFTHLELRGHPSNNMNTAGGGTSGIHMRWQDYVQGDEAGEGRADGVLMEGLRIWRFPTGISFKCNKSNPDSIFSNVATAVDFKVRRCSIHHNYSDSTGQDCQGIFIGNHTGTGAYVSNIIIEECMIFMNGWGTNHTPRDTGGGARDQGLYITDENRNLTFRYNQNYESAATGAQMRPGGICSNSYFQDCPVALTVGLVRGGSDPVPGGVETTTVRGSAFQNGKDYTPSVNRGKQITIANSQGGEVANNLVAHCRSFEWNAAQGIVLNLDIDASSETDIGIHNLTLTSNFIYECPSLRLTDFSESGTRASNILVQRNRFYVLTNSSDAATADELWVVSTQEDIGGSAQVTNVRFSSNVYYTINGPSQAFEYNNSLTDFADWGAATNANDSNSTLTNAVPSFTDTERYVETYYDGVMGTSGSTLTNYAHWYSSNMRLGTWNTNFRTTRIINHIREGFDLTSLPTNGRG